MFDEFVFFGFVFEAMQRQRIGIHANRSHRRTELVRDLGHEASLRLIIAILSYDKDEGDDRAGDTADGKDDRQNAEGDIATAFE